jgi:hypothetical protein
MRRAALFVALAVGAVLTPRISAEAAPLAPANPAAGEGSAISHVHYYGYYYDGPRYRYAEPYWGYRRYYRPAYDFDPYYLYNPPYYRSYSYYPRYYREYGPYYGGRYYHGGGRRAWRRLDRRAP